MKTKLNTKILIGNLLFVAVLLLIMARLLSVWSGTVFPLSLISANSMSPALMEGDIVAWEPVTIEDINVGDVIVYRSWLSWPDTKYVVHRVHEIKSVRGKPTFITKGDANEFTDQSGPHVVEPYVTEENFIGRTLSIGTQPLKIPLVGLIGIWVDEGFKSLAQSTATKGSLTYVGVFTPLTGSVILLIISLFILPEKAKTVKEKIRLHIFGFNKSSVKKIFVFFLIIYIIFLSTIHFFAYDSQSATLGIGEFPDEGGFELGSITPGTTKFMKNMPVANPGIFPLKGIIFGSGKLKPFIDSTTFEIAPGGFASIPVNATAPTASITGSYGGNIMIYSSPIWFIFPEKLMKNIHTIFGEATVFCLDVLSACFLTSITIGLIVSTEYISRKYDSLKIDWSWQHISKIYLKKGINQRITCSKIKIKQAIGRKIWWLNKINLVEIDPKKPILVSFIVIPMLLLISSEILAMIIASITAGIAAYFISCKVRKKIIFASILALTTGISYIIIKTNYYLITSNYSTIESLTLGIGAIGIYLLVLAFLLIPLSLISWYVAHLLRNLKERKDPLLILEGSCDL